MQEPYTNSEEEELAEDLALIENLKTDTPLITTKWRAALNWILEFDNCDGWRFSIIPPEEIKRIRWLKEGYIYDQNLLEYRIDPVLLQEKAWEETSLHQLYPSMTFQEAKIAYTKDYTRSLISKLTRAESHEANSTRDSVIRIIELEWESPGITGMSVHTLRAKLDEHEIQIMLKELWALCRKQEDGNFSYPMSLADKVRLLRYLERLIELWHPLNPYFLELQEGLRVEVEIGQEKRKRRLAENN